MKNIFLTFMVVVFSFSIVVGQENVTTNKNVLLIEQFKNTIKEQPGLLIDIRTPNEYEEGTIKGAMNIDFKNDNFKQEISKLDPQKPVYIFCQSGKRSAKAHKVFTELGFKNVYELAGGYATWINKE